MRIVFCLLLTLAATAGELVFHAPLDGTTTASHAAGDAACLTAGQRFGPGIDGQAAYLGTSRLTYATADNLPAERGAIAMWVMPLNWTAGDGQRHNFFGTDLVMDGKDIASQVSLYKYERHSSLRHSNRLVLFTARRLQRGDRTDFQRIGSEGIPIWDWQPGQWYFLVLTWNRRSGRMQVYIDGIKKLSRRMAPPTVFGDRFSIGSDRQPADDLAVDDVRVYQGPFTQKEIRALYLEIVDRQAENP